MARPKPQFNRYHHSICFPNELNKMMIEYINSFTDDIDLTSHAAEQMSDQKDPRGYIPLPTSGELLDNSNKLIEIYERLDKPGRIQKAVIRVGHLSEKYDYTYVVARDGVIVTSWINDKGDNHRLTNTANNYIQRS